MATTTTITKMLFRRGNDADRKQTILASGEPGWCLDTNRLWIGDGVTPGGYPALSACEHHVQYEPVGLNTPQALNVNIPGTVRTYTAQWNGTPPQWHTKPADASLLDPEGKYLYPACKDMQTYHDIYFKKDSAPGIIKGTKTGESLHIDCPDNGTIDLGNGALRITKDGSGNSSISMNLDNAVFEATKAVFDQGTDTHFEDKTIDLNVVYVDPDATDLVPEAPGTVTSHATNAGLFFAHNNYLSAGFMRMGNNGTNETAASVLEFCPAVYEQDWDRNLNSGDGLDDERGFVELDANGSPQHDYSGTSSDTDTWTGGGNVNGGSNRKAPKQIRVSSPRPENKDSEGYKGLSHLVLESGLISFGPGDPRTHHADDAKSLNAYLINQSVDTDAHPTFKGLTIKAGGEPIPVSSGGTGSNTLAARGALITPPGSTNGPVQSQPLAEGDFLVGKNGGVGTTRLDHSDHGHIKIDSVDGKQTITNLFSPSNDFGNNNDKADYILKFRDLKTDDMSGSITPSTNSSTIAFDGIQSTCSLSTAPFAYIKTSGASGATAAASVKFRHVATTATDNLYQTGKDNANIIYADDFTDLIDASEDDSTADTTTPAGYQDTGLVIGAVKINPMGHLENIRSKDLDTRYAKHLNMGSNARKTTPVNAPADESVSANTDAVTIPALEQRTYFPDVSIPSSTGFVKPIVGTQFNDYGTINSVSTVNLSDYYFDKGQTYGMFKAVGAALDGAIGSIVSNDHDIAALQDQLTNGVDKIKVINTVGNSDDTWNGLLFAHASAPANQSPFSTTVGCDMTDSKTLQYKPSTGDLKSLGTITATKYEGDGSDLTFDASADVVKKSTGGTFNGGIGISSNGSTFILANSSDYNKMELKSAKGVHFDFKNAENDDYDGRYMFTQEAASYTDGVAHRFIINGANSSTNKHIGGHDEVCRMTATHSAFHRDLHVGGLLSINSEYSNSNSQEGGQLELSDPNNTGGNAADKWKIDNYTDTGNLYGLGEDSNLLRFFRTGAGWAAFNNAGDFATKGDVIAYATSDKRLKKKVKAIKDPLDKIGKIGGYTFEWDEKKPSPRSGKDVGVIAQEIEKVLPEVVHERDNELKTKAVRYEKIIPLLIEGIKELTDKVAELEAQLKK